MLIFLLAIPVLFATNDAWGHEVRPAYLGLTEVERNTFDVTWKQPLLGDKRLGLDPILPSQCSTTIPTVDEVIPGALIRTWQVRCTAGAFAQEPISIDGLSSSLTDVWVVVRQVGSERGETTGRLTASQTDFWLQHAPRTKLTSYFSLGVTHLLSGVDHILFIIGLMFFISGFSKLLLTITAFTIAHSMTLAAATLGLVHLPQGPVEACIILSILFLAVEASSPDKAGTITARRPWLIAFVFGLLHGFGFAGALQDIGLPTGTTAMALILFNLGIEFGQVVVIASLLSLRCLLLHWPIYIPRWLAHAPVYAVGSVSAYWLLLRIWTNWNSGPI